jgi:DNA damage-binding protein 1
MFVADLIQVEGSLYVFGNIAPEYQDLLMTFQSNLEKAIQPECLGELEFTKWRAFRNAQRWSDGPFRFIDGEMLERFLDLDEVKQELVCEGLGPSVENMRDLVEELKRMH